MSAQAHVDGESYAENLRGVEIKLKRSLNQPHYGPAIAIVQTKKHGVKVLSPSAIFAFKDKFINENSNGAKMRYGYINIVLTSTGPKGEVLIYPDRDAQIEHELDIQVDPWNIIKRFTIERLWVDSSGVFFKTTPIGRLVIPLRSAKGEIMMTQVDVRINAVFDNYSIVTIDNKKKLYADKGQDSVFIVNEVINFYKEIFEFDLSTIPSIKL